MNTKEKILKIYATELRPPTYRYIAKKASCSHEYVRQVIKKLKAKK